MNQQPWQATINTAFLTKVIPTPNSLSVVKEEFARKSQKASTPVIKFADAKRYSFDDNGGGYQGL